MNIDDRFEVRSVHTEKPAFRLPNRNSGKSKTGGISALDEPDKEKLAMFHYNLYWNSILNNILFCCTIPKYWSLRYR
jgi:hypothetical protein